MPSFPFCIFTKRHCDLSACGPLSKKWEASVVSILEAWFRPLVVGEDGLLLFILSECYCLCIRRRLTAGLCAGCPFYQCCFSAGVRLYSETQMTLMLSFLVETIFGE